jgi:hypothetical protein
MTTSLTEAFRAARPASSNGTGPRPKRTPILVHAGRLAGRALPRWRVLRSAAMQYAAAGRLPRWRALRTPALCWSSGGLATWAGWQTDPRLGAAIAAAALLVIEAFSGEG